jgi:hypothetical protein
MKGYIGLDSINEIALNYINMAIKNLKQMKKIVLNSMNELPWFRNLVCILTGVKF